MLTARLAGEIGSHRYDIDLGTGDAPVTVLVGASGAGKTTILHLLAGLVRPAEGHLELNGVTYFDSLRSVWVPAHRRAIGYVLQEGALFPHLTAEANVSFGLEAQGLSRREARNRARAVLDRLGVGELASRTPSSLSGGEQQRVALCRALVLEPELLLLDEPLAAVDTKTRQNIRTELGAILREVGCTTIFVTHSPFEAMAFGDRIAVVEGGRIQQIGTGDELLRHPRSEHVAHLMGVNFFRGTIAQHGADGLATVLANGGEIHVVGPDSEATEVFVTVDPREITLHPKPPVGTAQNVFQGPIRELAPEPPRGERIRVVVGAQPTLVAEISAHVAAALSLEVGMLVYASFKATGARTFY